MEEKGRKRTGDMTASRQTGDERASARKWAGDGWATDR